MRLLPGRPDPDAAIPVRLAAASAAPAARPCADLRTVHRARQPVDDSTHWPQSRQSKTSASRAPSAAELLGARRAKRCASEGSAGASAQSRHRECAARGVAQPPSGARLHRPTRRGSASLAATRLPSSNAIASVRRARHRVICDATRALSKVTSHTSVRPSAVDADVDDARTSLTMSPSISAAAGRTTICCRRVCYARSTVAVAHRDGRSRAAAAAPSACRRVRAANDNGVPPRSSTPARSSSSTIPRRARTKRGSPSASAPTLSRWNRRRPCRRDRSRIMPRRSAPARVVTRTPSIAGSRFSASMRARRRRIGVGRQYDAARSTRRPRRPEPVAY